MNSGIFASEGKRMPNLWEGDGRCGSAVRALQIVLWSGQSVFWHAVVQ